MKHGDKVQFWGNEYTAVPYDERDTASFLPTDDDKQCKLCALEPNYCKMMDVCHNYPPFIFVKSIYVEAMKSFQF